MAKERAVKVLIDGATSDLTFSYLAPESVDVSPGQRVRVPLRNRSALGTVTEIEWVETDGLKYRLKPILGTVSDDAFLTPGLMKLAEWIATFYLAPIETVIRTMLPKPSRGEEEKRKKEKVVELLATVDDALLDTFGARQKRHREALRILAERGVTSLQELTGDLGIPRTALKVLEERGLIRLADRIVTRDPLDSVDYVESAPLVLNEEQAAVLEQIKASTARLESGEKVRPILLHGVTGSGKTEVYLQAIQLAVEAGKGAIVLVPEIALTPQTADRFKQRFAKIKDRVAILHSNLSEGERHDEWRKVLDQKARIVIGARSAIFSPIENLGLIVVDEEHENSYKQDTVPRYQARDIAVVRGHLEGCPVLLGSATPSLESWNNVREGKYELATMRLRIDDRKLPLIRIIDMRNEGRKSQSGPTILSTKLRLAMEQRLAKGEQTILFLNRRGFARNILCPECGYVANCRHCSTTLTLHRKEDRLICHICGFSQLPPRQCPECSGRSIVNAGYGTERVEEILRQVFTEATIRRVDTDSMRKKNELRDTLNAFRARKIDILLGTQMIAKGLDFPNVRLVGVVSADTALALPDFRAGERTFQLVSQVSGRAGRGEKPGRAVIQSFEPETPAIRLAATHDFEKFATQELEDRRQFHLPPYRRMARLILRHPGETECANRAAALAAELQAFLGPVELRGPSVCPIARIAGKYRRQIELLADHAADISKVLAEARSRGLLKLGEELAVDVDPLSAV